MEFITARANTSLRLDVEARDVEALGPCCRLGQLPLAGTLCNHTSSGKQWLNSVENETATTFYIDQGRSKAVNLNAVSASSVSLSLLILSFKNVVWNFRV
jgi:hypothetical protein